MILHLVNRSPLQSQALELCLRFASEQDCLLLIEDGVIAAAGTRSLLPQQRLSRIAALKDDVESRGLSRRLAAGIDVVDYDEFVAMCCRCDKVQSWF